MKKILCLILSLAILFAPCTMTADELIVSEWAEDAVERAIKLGWTREHNFTENITRGEFCHIVTNAVIACGLDIKFYSMDTPFTDIEETYEIEYLYCLGVIKGKTETLFCPDDLLNREEAAVIFKRIIDAFREWEIADINTDAVNDWAYADHGDISDWAKNDVYTISNLGIMKGKTTGFEPNGSLTYEEAIMMLVRLYDLRWRSSGAFADKLNSLMPRDKNYIFSPLSIKMALGLTSNGGDAEFEEILMENLFDESNVNYYNTKAKDFINKYLHRDKLSLDVANSIWVNKDETKSDFADEFKITAQKYYNADYGRVNKTNAVETINNWVSDKTRGKIESILNEGDNDFSVAIVNAVYFKGEWLKVFDEANTKKDIFTDGDGNEVKTLFMNQTDSFKYYNDGEIELVELPYKCDKDMDVSMSIILGGEDISLEEKLLYLKNGYLRYETVKLSVPKFEMEYTDSLKDELIELGAEKVFENGFNNIIENEELFIDDVLHKTYIKVDEEKTEAAAVTEVEDWAIAMETEPVVFKADKPFCFVIRDNISSVILFMGRYAYVE